MYKISNWLSEKRLEIILSLLFGLMAYIWALGAAYIIFLIGSVFLLTSKNLKFISERILVWISFLKDELVFSILVVFVFLLPGSSTITNLLLIVTASFVVLIELQYHSRSFKGFSVHFIELTKTRLNYVLLALLFVFLLILWGFDTNSIVCMVSVCFCLFSEKRDRLLSILSTSCLLICLFFVLLGKQEFADFMATDAYIFISLAIALRLITRGKNRLFQVQKCTI